MNDSSPLRKKYFTPSEVAEILMVSPVTVRQLSQKGELDSVLTPGGHRRYLYKHIEAFARARNLPLNIRDYSGLRVLIVDDDEQFARYLEELLTFSSEVSEVKVANEGFRAGSLLYTFEPHIVLLDLMMPYIDGFTVCSDIKSGQMTKDIRVIAMTGYYSKENVGRILSAGVEVCLKKPFEPEDLFNAMGIKAEDE
ncbi:MAG: response regulator [Gammaproteobacteria bacterium]